MNRSGIKGISAQGGILLSSFFLTALLLIAFYLLVFFISFNIGSFRGISIALLSVMIILSSFSIGVLLVSVEPISSRARSILKDTSFISLLLAAPTIVSASGTDAFGIVFFIMLPVVLFHAAILGLSLSSFLKNKVSVSPRRIANAAEKRKSVRIKGYATAERKGGDGLWRPVGVYDVSGSGIRLITEDGIREGEELELKIHIPQDNRPIFTKGKVVWSRSFDTPRRIYHSGVKFRDIESADRMRLTLKQVYNLFQEPVS